MSTAQQVKITDPELLGLVKEVRGTLARELDWLFNNPNAQRKAVAYGNVIDLKNKRAELRLATLVYCHDVDAVIYPYMRLGIVADKGLRHLIENKAEELGLHLRPPTEVRRKTVRVNGWEVAVFGRADLEFVSDSGTVIPVEFKASTNSGTVERGRGQAALYAWLYDAPLGVLIYGPRFTYELVKRADEKTVKERVWLVLKHLIAGFKDFPCPTLKVELLSAPPRLHPSD